MAMEFIVFMTFSDFSVDDILYIAVLLFALLGSSIKSHQMIVERIVISQKANKLQALKILASKPFDNEATIIWLIKYTAYAFEQK